MGRSSLAKYAEGVSQLSPGLVARVTYPGLANRWNTYPEGVAQHQREEDGTPLGYEALITRRPRVARQRSQPWADGCNPFGIPDSDYRFATEISEITQDSLLVSSLCLCGNSMPVFPKAGWPSISLASSCENQIIGSARGCIDL